MDHLQAVYEICKAHLVAAEWTQAYPSGRAPSGAARPYVVFFWAGGGDLSISPEKQNAQITLSVKCVADTLGEALAGKAKIIELLRNSGSQDISPSLPTHPDWIVTTVTQDRDIFLEEPGVGGAALIYHAGNQYVWTLERRA